MTARATDKRITINISKSIYLLVLMLMSVSFFHFSPISFFTNQDICLILYLFWLLLGHFIYKKPQEYTSLLVKNYYWTLLLIWLGVIISFIPAAVIFGQSFITSFVSSRFMLALAALPILGVVRPKLIDIEKAVVSFATILLVFSILDAIEIPVIDRTFFIPEEAPNRELIDEDSFVMLLPGFQWVAVALFFYLFRLGKKVSTRSILGSILFMGGVYLIQNRTMLFVCALAFAYTLFKIRGEDRRQTYILRLCSIILVIVAIGITMPQLVRLFTETTTQLGNTDYNRILAYNYFLFQAPPGFLYYFTGTGFISANTSSIMQDLMAEGIYNSDVGFIGFWNYYGILPIIAFVVVTIKGLVGKTSLFVKYNALLILFGSLTISCFNAVDKQLWLCVFIYLVFERPGFKPIARTHDHTPKVAIIQE